MQERQSAAGMKGALACADDREKQSGKAQVALRLLCGARQLPAAHRGGRAAGGRAHRLAVSSTMPILMALPNSFHRVLYACRSSSRCAIALSADTGAPPANWTLACHAVPESAELHETR